MPRLGSERSQRGGRVKGTGADLDIVGLKDDAALARPKPLQVEDQRLETQGCALDGEIVSAAGGNRAGRRRARPLRCSRRSPRSPPRPPPSLAAPTPPAPPPI